MRRKDEEESTRGEQVTPSPVRSSPAGQRHTAWGPGARRHMWEHCRLSQGLDVTDCKRGWMAWANGGRLKKMRWWGVHGDFMSRHVYTNTEFVFLLLELLSLTAHYCM